MPCKEGGKGDRDGLPNVIMEAATQALPILSTRFAGVPEFVREGVEGLLVPPGRCRGAGAGARAADPRRPIARPPRTRRRLERVRTDFSFEAGIATLVSKLGSTCVAGGLTMTALAFYAPMKPPDHPVPSGDREIARLLLRLLPAAGFRPEVASRLVSYDKAGDAAAQERIAGDASAEVARLVDLYGKSPARPALWFTYHVYYKAPDLIGPKVARALAIPYVIAEGSRAGKRRQGPWARWNQQAEEALDEADLIFVCNRADMPALEWPGRTARRWRSCRPSSTSRIGRTARAKRPAGRRAFSRWR